MGRLEGPWNTWWKAACPAACISTSRPYNIAKMPTMQSWHEAMPGQLMRYDRAGALGRPRLDWTLRCGQPEGCVCLHAGQQAAWGGVAASLQIGQIRAARAARPTQTSGAGPSLASPCRQQSRARQQQHACRREAGGLGGSCCSACCIRSPCNQGHTTGSPGRSWVGDWAAVEAEWQMASGLLCCSVSDGAR